MQCHRNSQRRSRMDAVRSDRLRWVLSTHLIQIYFSEEFDRGEHRIQLVPRPIDRDDDRERNGRPRSDRISIAVATAFVGDKLGNNQFHVCTPV